MKNKPAPQSALICLFIVLAFASHSSPARAAATAWTGAAGNDWFNAANWTNGVPNSARDASIDVNVKAEIAQSGATAATLILGTGVQDTGTLIVDGTTGGTLAVLPCTTICPEGPAPGNLCIGYEGRGELNIINGGTVGSAGYAYIAAVGGRVVNSNGVVTVDGTGSTWILSAGARLFIGGPNNPNLEGGVGLLSVTNGGHVIVAGLSNAPGLVVGTSGTLTGDGTVTVNAGTFVSRVASVQGTLAPIGTLHLNSHLSLSSSASTVCNVTPGAADRVELVGVAFLGGRLSVTMTGTFTPAITRYTLMYASEGRAIEADRFQSVSINYPTDQNFTPRITYDGNYVYLDLDFTQ